MAITRTPIIDDDGSGHVGTIINNAWKQELYGQIDGAFLAAPAVVVNVSAAVGVVNDWAPGIAGNTLLSWYQGAAVNTLTVTGIAPGVRGSVVRFCNFGSAIAYFAHQHAGSAVINRLYNQNSGNTAIFTNGFIEYIHNGDSWVESGRDQGFWIDVPFNAANFTGGGAPAMTWTVSAGNVIHQRYLVMGKTVFWSVNISGSSLSGTAAAQVRIVLPVGPARMPALLSPTTQVVDGVAYPGYVIPTVGGYAGINKITVANYALNAGGTNVSFTIVYELG